MSVRWRIYKRGNWWVIHDLRTERMRAFNTYTNLVAWCGKKPWLVGRYYWLSD